MGLPNKGRIRILLLLAGLLLSPLGDAKARASLGGQGENKQISSHFRVPPELQTKVDFWKKIYSEYTTSQVVIHDDENLDVIYEVVNLNELPPRTREVSVRKAKDKYRNILRRLAGSHGQGDLSQEELRVRNLAKGDFSRASERVRGQLGQADRFREGMVRSGRYIDQMEDIFGKYNLPLELTALPHVESSFQIGAYSKLGAAGIWQFTHSTGKIFMNINYEVDERRDPLIATDAAARLLRKNYQETGSWPLAITAYNHGLNGMMRAKQQFGDDIVKIINKYQSKAFGFASRNFYCEFLAALHVSRNKEKYAPNLKFDPPFVYDTLTLDHYYDFRQLASNAGLSPAELAEFNPGLRLPVVRGEKRVPKGTTLKLPRNKGKELAPVLAEAKEGDRFAEQKRSKWYEVKRGDTMGRIARRFGTSASTLAQLNHMHSGSRLSPGQVLHLPQDPGLKDQEVQKSSDTAAAPEPTKPATVSAAAEPAPGAYTVKEKDTINSLARRHGIKVENLLAWNRLKKNSMLRAGQTLLLKGPEPEKAQGFEKQEKTLGPDRPEKTEVSVKPEGSEKVEAQARLGEKANTADSAGDAEPMAKNDTPAPAAQESATKPDAVKVSALSGVEVLKSAKQGNPLGVMVTVENNETLGHYSEWSELTIADIKKNNSLRKKSIKVGDRIRLVFKKVTPEEFVERRREFHDSFREDFYSNFDVTRVDIIKVKPGQSLWEICNAVYEIPYWLLKDYNPETDITKLKPGQDLNIPIVNSKNPKNTTT